MKNPSQQDKLVFGFYCFDSMLKMCLLFLFVFIVRNAWSDVSVGIAGRLFTVGGWFLGLTLFYVTLKMFFKFLFKKYVLKSSLMMNKGKINRLGIDCVMFGVYLGVFLLFIK